MDIEIDQFYDESIQGTLQIKLLNAHLERDTEYFSKLDPYVVLQYNAHIQQSDIKDNAGLNPEFNQTLTFRVNTNVSNEILAHVYDSESTTNDVLNCTGSISVMQAIQNQKGIKMMVKMYYKNKEVGQLYYQTHFVPETIESQKMNIDVEQIESMLLCKMVDKVKKMEQEFDEQNHQDSEQTKEGVLESIETLKTQIANIKAQLEPIETEIDQKQKEVLELQEMNQLYLSKSMFINHDAQQVNSKIQEMYEGFNCKIKLTNIKIDLYAHSIGIFDTFRPQVRFWVNDVNRSTKTIDSQSMFLIINVESVKVDFDDVLEFQSNNVYILQFEIYKEYDGEDEWVCANSMLITKYQKEKEHDIKCLLVKLGTKSDMVKGTISFKLFITDQ